MLHKSFVAIIMTNLSNQVSDNLSQEKICLIYNGRSQVSFWQFLISWWPKSFKYRRIWCLFGILRCAWTSKATFTPRSELLKQCKQETNVTQWWIPETMSVSERWQVLVAWKAFLETNLQTNKNIKYWIHNISNIFWKAIQNLKYVHSLKYLGPEKKILHHRMHKTWLWHNCQ